MVNKTRVFQNAIRTPSGFIMCSRNEKETVSYKDPIDENIYVVAGGCKNPVRDFPPNNSDLFEDLYLTELSTVEEIKDKLVWGTYDTVDPTKRTDDNFRFKKLKDLESAHLEAIMCSRSLSNLYRFIIGLILQDRSDVWWNKKPKAKIIKDNRPIVEAIDLDKIL